MPFPQIVALIIGLLSALTGFSIAFFLLTFGKNILPAHYTYSKISKKRVVEDPKSAPLLLKFTEAMAAILKQSYPSSGGYEDTMRL